MSDLISKSRLRNELSKIPSEMGLIKKAWVMQTVSKQKTQDSNNNCSCRHNSNSRDNEPCCRCDSRKTNADRIRNMSDEELAMFIGNLAECINCDLQCSEKCIATIDECCRKHLEWLQLEAE